MARFKTRRQARYDILRSRGFSHAEALETSRLAKKKFKVSRQDKYQYLRGEHFTTLEAFEFSKLDKKYPALQQIIRERGFQWRAFQAKCRAKGWRSEVRRQREWGDWLGEFYSKRHYATREGKQKIITWVVTKDRKGRTLKQPRISPWDWYDYIFAKLPDQLKWDTPRSARLKKQPDVQVDRLQTRRWVEDLKKSRDRAITQSDKAKFQTQINNLERSLRRAK